MLRIYLNTLITHEDRVRFELLYNQYKRLMFVVAMSYLKDSYKAEDAVHEAFIRIIKNFEKIDEIICPKTKRYIVIIVENICRDELRRQRRLPIEGDCVEDDSYDPMQSISDYQNDTQQMEDISNAYEAISALSDKYRDVLFLRFVMGYTAEETGNILGISTELVYKRIARARAILRKEM